MTVILGVDPSLTRTGLAAVQFGDIPGREKVLALASIPTGPGDEDMERIMGIVGFALAFAGTVPAGVDVVAIEKVHLKMNPQTALRLANLGGALREAFTSAGYVVVDVHNAQRLAALGVKRGDGLKGRIKAAVLSRFGVKCGNDDEADAVGIALAGHRNWQRSQRPAGQAKLPLGKARGKRPLPKSVTDAMG